MAELTWDERLDKARTDGKYAITITMEGPDQPVIRAMSVTVGDERFDDWHTLPRSKRHELLRSATFNLCDAIACLTAERDGAPACVLEETPEGLIELSRIRARVGATYG